MGVAHRDISAGEQLFFSYGPRPSRDFLLTWGFLPAWNAHDDCIIFGDITEAMQWCRNGFQMPVCCRTVGVRHAFDAVT